MIGTVVAAGAAAAQSEQPKVKGRIHQSVCKWCYPKLSVEELAAEAKKMGIVAVDLLRANEYEAAQKYGLTPSMGYACTTIPDGLNNKALHPKFEAEFREAVDLAAKAKVPNLICFSGNRRGMSNEEGWENCTLFLRKMMPVAEDKGINIQMELLNSKVNHKDYMCDHTAWGVELAKRVGSPRFKLLYDIYHMQIMEGDVIRTIRDNAQYIGHYHTGGVPGRNEIDQSQELYYPAIVKAIIDLGFTGFMAHEFIPKREPLASLKEAVQLCDV